MDQLRFCTWLLAGLMFAALPSAAQGEALPPGQAARMDIPSAVNLAGRQRMLSQRMAKAYLMLGQGIAADEARAMLQESISQFESQLATLKGYQPTALVRKAMAGVEREWLKCRALLTAAPSKAGAIELYDANEALQQAAHSLTLAYEIVAISPHSYLVDIGGRQRMLSQRMAKFYFYRTWDLYDAPADMELHLSRAHFTAVLIRIENSLLATAAIRSSVAKIRREWKTYEQALFADRAPAGMRKNALRVAESSERVLAAVEELVALLVAQAQAAQA